MLKSRRDALATLASRTIRGEKRPQTQKHASLTTRSLTPLHDDRKAFGEENHCALLSLALWLQTVRMTLALIRHPVATATLVRMEAKSASLQDAVLTCRLFCSFAVAYFVQC